MTEIILNKKTKVYPGWKTWEGNGENGYYRVRLGILPNQQENMVNIIKLKIKLLGNLNMHRINASKVVMNVTTISR